MLRPYDLTTPYWAAATCLGVACVELWRRWLVW